MRVISKRRGMRKPSAPQLVTPAVCHVRVAHTCGIHPLINPNAQTTIIRSFATTILVDPRGSERKHGQRLGHSAPMQSRAILIPPMDTQSLRVTEADRSSDQGRRVSQTTGNRSAAVVSRNSSACSHDCCVLLKISAHYFFSLVTLHASLLKSADLGSC